jgi:hypothetical protein
VAIGMSVIQPVPYVSGEEFQVGGNAVGTAGPVAPDAGDHGERPVAQVGELGLVVRDAEVQVGSAGHEQDAGGDRGQGGGEIAVVQGVGADVGLVPGDGLGVQVRGAERAPKEASQSVRRNVARSGAPSAVWYSRSR